MPEFMKPAHYPPEMLVKEEFEQNETNDKQCHVKHNLRAGETRKNRWIAEKDDPDYSEWNPRRATPICCDLENGKRDRP